MTDDDVKICFPSCDNFGPERIDHDEHPCDVNKDDDFLPKDHPFFHPSNLDHVQELIKNSQKGVILAT